MFLCQFSLYLSEAGFMKISAAVKTLFENSNSLSRTKTEHINSISLFSFFLVLVNYNKFGLECCS